MNTDAPRFKIRRVQKIGVTATLAFALFVMTNISMPPQAFAQSKSLAANSIPNSRLLGSGILRWLAFKVYDARLYAPKELANEKNWQLVPLALELTYARSIKGEQIAQTSADEIKRLGTNDSAKIALWSAAMKQLFPDVKEGDQLVGVYKPNQSVAFFHNGKPLTIPNQNAGGPSNIGALSDPGFGKAFFAIWLDTKTRDQGLRKALLGQLADEATMSNTTSSSNLNQPATTN
jgi:Chalcone isomerase-like